MIFKTFVYFVTLFKYHARTCYQKGLPSTVLMASQCGHREGSNLKTECEFSHESRRSVDLSLKVDFFLLGSRFLISAHSGVVQFRPALACRSRIFRHHISEYLPEFPSCRRAAVSGGRVRYAWERGL